MSMASVDAPARTGGTALVHRLAAHAAGLGFEAIPPEIIGLAKDHLVHHCGLALAAVGYPRSRRARSLAERLSGGEGRHRILGTPGRYGLLEAVFANSLLMGEDALDDAAQGGTHPGVLVFPPALGMTETGLVGGRKLLTAVVVGYDVLVALARGAWTWGVSTPRRSGCVVGPVGAAAVTSRVLGLDAERTAAALGLAANGAIGLIEGTPSAGVLYPQVARNGVMAALLAAEGFGSTPTILEGPHGLYETYLGAVPDEVVSAMDGLGTSFGIAHAFRKRYACSGFNVVPVELMADLIRTTGMAVDDVALIRLTLPEERRPREEDFDRNFRRYRGAPERRYITRYASPRFLVAAWLWDGRLNPARYREDMPAGFLDLVARTSMDFVKGLPLRSARLTVVTTHGQEHVREGHAASPTPPMDHRQWMADLLPAAPPAAIEGFVASVERLEESPDTAELWTALDWFAARATTAPAVSPGLDRRPGSTASRRIASYTAGARYEDFPPAVLERGKDLLVHHLALALRAGSAGIPPAAPPGNYSAIGRAPSFSLLDAVSANSLSMQAAGRQDSMTGGMRPGAMIVPAALALVENRTVPGRELLAAIAVGYDAGLALSADTWAWGAATARRADCVFGPVAVACTAARLLGLDEERAADSIGQACHLTMGLIEGVDEEAVVNAQLARNGVFAALLAEADFPAADSMVEGGFGLYESTLGSVPVGLDAALARLGVRFGLDEAVVGRFAVHPHHFVPIELAFRIAARPTDEAEEPAAAEVLLPDVRRRWDALVRASRRRSGEHLSQADSLRVAVAGVLAGGDPGEAGNRTGATMGHAGRADRVTLRYRRIDDPYFARVTVTAASGAVARLEGDRSILPAHVPDRRASLVDAVPAGSRGRIDEVLDMVGSLERVGDSSTLLEAMVALCG